MAPKNKSRKQPKELSDAIRACRRICLSFRKHWDDVWSQDAPPKRQRSFEHMLETLAWNACQILNIVQKMRKPTPIVVLVAYELRKLWWYSDEYRDITVPFNGVLIGTMFQERIKRERELLGDTLSHHANCFCC